MLPNSDVWTFNAHEDRVELEDSVYLSGTDGPRRAVQIVIYGQARRVPRVHLDAVPVDHRSRRWTPRRGDELRQSELSPPRLAPFEHAPRLNLDQLHCRMSIGTHACGIRMTKSEQ